MKRDTSPMTLPVAFYPEGMGQPDHEATMDRIIVRVAPGSRYLSD